nr:26S proteasome regulatory subunit 4 A like [Tanacetum cinerariifolium]
ATFLRVFGSELIQKYRGDGSKLVRVLLRVADDLSPSIVFIDEIDAIVQRGVCLKAPESFNLCSTYLLDNYR